MGKSPRGSHFHSFEDARSYPVHVSTHEVLEHVKKSVTCCCSRISESYSNSLLYEITQEFHFRLSRNNSLKVWGGFEPNRGTYAVPTDLPDRPDVDLWENTILRKNPRSMLTQWSRSTVKACRSDLSFGTHFVRKNREAVRVQPYEGVLISL